MRFAAPSPSPPPCKTSAFRFGLASTAAKSRSWTTTLLVWQSPSPPGSPLADPDQVLVTSTVRDLTAGSDLAYAPRGAHDLKGVPGAWTVLEAVEGQEHSGELLATTEPSLDFTGR